MVFRKPAVEGVGGLVVRFKPVPLKDVWIVKREPVHDERGFFARTFCRREFQAHGIDFSVAQCNVSFNEYAGTLRGLHYQEKPAAEGKLVSCLRGALYDVIVDLRSDSPSYLKHFGIRLAGNECDMLYIPRGFAHGFLTLEDDTQISYMMDEFYAPGCGCGLRYDDPVLGIEWPVPVRIVSEKDREWPLIV